MGLLQQRLSDGGKRRKAGGGCEQQGSAKPIQGAEHGEGGQE